MEEKKSWERKTPPTLPTTSQKFVLSKGMETETEMFACQIFAGAPSRSHRSYSRATTTDRLSTRHTEHIMHPLSEANCKRADKVERALFLPEKSAHQESHARKQNLEVFLISHVLALAACNLCIVTIFSHYTERRLGYRKKDEEHAVDQRRSENQKKKENQSTISKEKKKIKQHSTAPGPASLARRSSLFAPQPKEIKSSGRACYTPQREVGGWRDLQSKGNKILNNRIRVHHEPPGSHN